MNDVIIIGGSFAGLAGAPQLGRARRKVTVLDTGLPRNRFAGHSHGLLGHDHKPPVDILAEARRQSSMAGSSRSPIAGAITPPSSSIPAPMSRSTSCSRIRATSRPQACMNHWASPRSIRPAVSPSRSTSAAKPACPAFTPRATSPTPSCPQSLWHHRTARRRVSPPSSRCWFKSLMTDELPIVLLHGPGVDRAEPLSADALPRAWPCGSAPSHGLALGAGSRSVR